MNRMICFLVSLIGLTQFGAGAATADLSLVPQNAQSVLYFPHLTEGGPNANNAWQVTFNFVNTNSTTANVSVSFYNDDGSQMMLDFGSGPMASISVAIPPNGTHMFRSQLTHVGPQAVWGWAAGQSDVPVFAQLNYRNMSNGMVTAELATNATTGTAQWTSMASAGMGIAVANPSPTDSMTYTVDVKDVAGNDVGSQSYQLAAHGHDAFNLNKRFTLPTDFSGSVMISGQTASQSIYKPVVWAVGTDSGAYATLPDGRSLMPDDQMARAMRVWGRVLGMAHQLGYNVTPSLTLPPGTDANGIANAMGNLGANGMGQVTMYMSLVEMTGDSDGELAFLMAHELGHVIQCKMKGCKVPMDSRFGSDYESDADEIGMMLSTSAGYDSFSGVAAYAKLQMGNGTQIMNMGGGMMGSAIVWEDITSGSPQGYFAGHINMMFTVQQNMCNNPAFPTGCQAFKNLMHPSMGGMMMLM